jgi:predicted ATP-grasp superfamily ATP-dependent carboligase
MKESKLIEMSNKVDTVGMAMNRVVQELGNLKDLSIGLTELVKLMPGYDEGLEKMKENLKKEQNKEQEVKLE